MEEDAGICANLIFAASVSGNWLITEKSLGLKKRVGNIIINKYLFLKNMIDPIADMLTRIRNAVLVNKTEVIIPFSKVKSEVAKILEREGFIKGIEKVDESDKKEPFLRIILKYKDKISVVREITRISKPGLRVYQGYKEIPKILPSLGILILSTSRGLMTNIEAKQQKVGGEIICEIS